VTVGNTDLAVCQVSGHVVFATHLFQGGHVLTTKWRGAFRT